MTKLFCLISEQMLTGGLPSGAGLEHQHNPRRLNRQLRIHLPLQLKPDQRDT